MPAEGINTEVPVLEGDSHSTVDGPTGREYGDDAVPAALSSDDGTGRRDSPDAVDPDEIAREERP